MSFMSTEENKALACRALEEIWIKRNLTAAEATHEPNYVGHQPAGGEAFSAERAHQPL